MLRLSFVDRTPLWVDEADEAESSINALTILDHGYPTDRYLGLPLYEKRNWKARLRALEARIRRAEEITHECHDEMRGLLDAFARSREAKAERWGKKSGTPERG